MLTAVCSIFEVNCSLILHVKLTILTDLFPCGQSSQKGVSWVQVEANLQEKKQMRIFRAWNGTWKTLIMKQLNTKEIRRFQVECIPTVYVFHVISTQHTLCINIYKPRVYHIIHAPLDANIRQEKSSVWICWSTSHSKGCLTSLRCFFISWYLENIA